MIKTYKYNDKTQLTTHFNVREWKCKCGKSHEIKIDIELPKLLEKLMTKIGAVRGDISSGYRCPAHDKAVGGTGSITHQGYACDIKFTDKNGKVINSKYVALALEDLGHKYGIGYKCGGSSSYTHIDVRPRKWYGDESKSMSKSCCDSFYDYFGIAKPVASKPKVTYLENKTYKGSSISEALKQIGANNSYSYRSKLASKNGINSYKGTASQNTKMLNLLKKGKLIKA